MPEKKRPSRQQKPSDLSGLDELLDATPTDLELLRQGSQQLKPLIQEFRLRLLRSIQPASYKLPSKRVWRKIEKELPNQYKELRTQLSRLKGERLTDKEFDRLMHAGVEQARKATIRMMHPWDGVEQLTVRNLTAEGTYHRSGPTFIWATPGIGPDIVLNLSDTEDLTTAQIILITSIVVEIVGFVFALFGVIFPKVDLVKLWNRVFRTRSRTVIRQMTRLLEILTNAQKTAGEKLEAILKFVNVLANLGILSDLVAQIFHDMSWWRIGLLIVQFLAQLALWLFPGAQAALAAQKAIALANAIVSLTTKARDLGDMLSEET